MVKSAVGIPVIVSCSAGHVKHFSDVFQDAHADAALAAGIFHRNVVLSVMSKSIYRVRGFLSEWIQKLEDSII